MTFSGGFGNAFRPAFDPGLTARNGLLNSLIAYWKMDEASGNALDVHTNGLDLTDINTVTNAAGKVYATARQFVAGNQEALQRAGDDALLSTGDVDFTLALWIKWPTLVGPANHLAGKDSEAAGGREYRLDWLASSNRVRMRVFDGSTQVGIATANTFGALSTGTWYLLVGYHDSVANQVGIQVNGGTVDTAATSGTPADTLERFSVGRCGSVVSSPSTAVIGPVAFWKSAAGGGGVLTAAQRTALYNGGAGLAYANFTT